MTHCNNIGLYFTAIRYLIDISTSAIMIVPNTIRVNRYSSKKEEKKTDSDFTQFLNANEHEKAENSYSHIPRKCILYVKHCPDFSP